MGSNDGTLMKASSFSYGTTFKMTKTEVTVDQYGACVDAGSCSAPGTGTYCNWDKSDRFHPINCVDWDRQLCELGGGRLPVRQNGSMQPVVEVDWKYPWGDEDAT